MPSTTNENYPTHTRLIELEHCLLVLLDTTLGAFDENECPISDTARIYYTGEIIVNILMKMNDDQPEIYELYSNKYHPCICIHGLYTLANV